MMSLTLSPTHHIFTLKSLSKRGADRAAFEDWAESQAPRVVEGESLDDVLDRLDGSSWRVGYSMSTVDLGSSMASPVYRRLRSLLARVVRECSQ
jgi:hypothetical protein